MFGGGNRASYGQAVHISESIHGALLFPRKVSHTSLHKSLHSNGTPVILGSIGIAIGIAGRDVVFVSASFYYRKITGGGSVA